MWLCRASPGCSNIMANRITENANKEQVFTVVSQKHHNVTVQGPGYQLICHCTHTHTHTHTPYTHTHHTHTPYTHTHTTHTYTHTTHTPHTHTHTKHVVLLLLPVINRCNI